MRAGACAILLLAASLGPLAGCLGADGGDDDGPVPSSGPPGTGSSTTTPTVAPPAPASLVVDLLPDFAFEPCRGISVQAVRPLEEVQALLPDGFTAAPAFGVEGSAVVGVDLYACGNLTTPNTRIADTVFGQVYTQILRPEERVPGAPEAAVQEYAFRLLAAQDVLARLWPSAGYDTRNGTAVVAIGPPADAPVDVGLRIGNASVGADYHLLASGSPPFTSIPQPGTFARYTALADGSVLVWTGTYSFPAFTAGSGTLEVPADDPFAGFEAAGRLAGPARLYETGGILDQDLRRYF